MVYSVYHLYPPFFLLYFVFILLSIAPKALYIIFYINFLLRRMDAAHSSKISVFISSNVPGVYDVFAVAIKEREAFQQPQKCGWSVAWEWSVAE
jgi:hypothetical protein